MHRRRAWSSLLLVGLVVIAGCIGGSPPGSASDTPPERDDPPEGDDTAVSHAKIERIEIDRTPPDRANFTVSVGVNDDDGDSFFFWLLLTDRTGAVVANTTQTGGIAEETFSNNFDFSVKVPPSATNYTLIGQARYSGFTATGTLPGSGESVTSNYTQPKISPDLQQAVAQAKQNRTIHANPDLVQTRNKTTFLVWVFPQPGRGDNSPHGIDVTTYVSENNGTVTSQFGGLQGREDAAVEAWLPATAITRHYFRYSLTLHVRFAKPPNRTTN